jgi:hypothetical protein
MENEHAIKNPAWPFITLWSLLVFFFLSAVAWAQTTTDTHGIQGAVPNLNVSLRVLAIMGVVFAVVQAIKMAFPAIAGIWAIIFNVVLSVAGVVVAIPAEKLFSYETLTTVLVAAIGAAGIHGTVSSMRTRAQLKRAATTYPASGYRGGGGPFPPSGTEGRHP